MDMRRFLPIAFLLTAVSGVALPTYAQNPTPCVDGLEVVIIPEGGGDPIYECRQINGAQKPALEPDTETAPDSDDSAIGDEFFEGDLSEDAPSDETPPSDTPALPTLPFIPEGNADPEQSLAEGAAEARPDIIIHSDEDRKNQLDKLFAELAEIEDTDKANLLAEEIWAIWLQSGSVSVDYILLRGTTAQKSGNTRLARRMYERVLVLEPDYAEGWTRSGRLALEEEDLPRAMADITQSLILEPRHFYSLWTLGNIFERLEQRDEAFEAYSEALKLYPALKAVKDRVEYLREDVQGKSL